MRGTNEVFLEYEKYLKRSVTIDQFHLRGTQIANARHRYDWLNQVSNHPSCASHLTSNTV
jgi:hypothetical protein